MSAPTFTPAGAFGRFAAHLIDAEFPDLPAARRSATIEFCCRRASRLPSHLVLGVRAVLGAIDASGRFVGTARAAEFTRNSTLPAVGDLARLVRSLAVAHIWERWPDTGPAGAPRTSAGVAGR